MIDELISNDNPTKCYHCRNDLKEKGWKSEWNPGHHYKTIICDQCGKKSSVTVKFEGSGHDDWKPNGDKNNLSSDLLHSPRVD